MRNKNSNALSDGEYALSDPMLLQTMRLTRDILVPNSKAILIARYTPITKKLLKQLTLHHIVTVFAEPIKEPSLAPTIKHMEKMFHVIDEIVVGALGNIDDMAESFQNRRDQKILERLVRDNLDDIQELFSADPTEKLVALTQHHSGSARHSIIASFHMMALGRELGWSESKIVKAAIAVFNHDVGKTRVKLDTLNWPGRLNSEKWKEIQYHTLFGGLLFHQRGKQPELPMLAALLHHEWYANIEGKGYGGLTLFVDYLKKILKLDLPKIIAESDPDDVEIIQATALTDMVSALEERRSYKRELDSFKVMIIMNSDAKLGHFHPQHYAAWHRIYQRQHPNLLPLGLRVALPREKEKRIFRPLKPTHLAHPVPLLTYYEIEQLGLIQVLRNIGMDVERVRRRGGLLLKVIEQIKKEKKLQFDCSLQALAAQEITLLKDQIIPEEEVIELDAWREWLTYDDLERSELLSLVHSHHFDVTLIRMEGGINPARLVNRGLRIQEKKLHPLGISLLKPWNVRLPASENRLTTEDLLKLGVNEAQLKKSGCLERVQKLKSGVPMRWLMERGITFSLAEIAKCGIDPIRKVFYDIQVTQEINTTRAKFIILREGDEYKHLEQTNEQQKLEPIQELLLNQVGEIVLDFADLVAMPDLSHIKLGRHWLRGDGQ